jgi:PTH1 family peptidyl-tRNA hydrolase
MNTSGDAVKALLDHYALPSTDLLIVHDDVALPHFGMLRFQHAGKAGGHHGIEHTVAAINTNEFDRLKVGVGPDPGGALRYQFVLAKLDDILPRYLQLIDKSAESVKVWVASGVAMASNKFNKKEPHA